MKIARVLSGLTIGLGVAQMLSALVMDNCNHTTSEWGLHGDSPRPSKVISGLQVNRVVLMFTMATQKVNGHGSQVMVQTLMPTGVALLSFETMMAVSGSTAAPVIWRYHNGQWVESRDIESKPVPYGGQFIRGPDGILRAATGGGIYRLNSDQKWVVEWKGRYI